MKKSISYGLLMIIMASSIPFALATTFVGDNVNFQTAVKNCANCEAPPPYDIYDVERCGEYTTLIPQCKGPEGAECESFNEQECETLGMEDCRWATPESECEYMECTWDNRECDNDMSDEKGTWLYAGYALKDPSGAIAAQQTPQGYCTGDYNPSIQYTVNEAGTWKFCGAIFATEASYENSQCSSNTEICSQNCIEVNVVVPCNMGILEQNIFSQYSSWLDTW